MNLPEQEPSWRKGRKHVELQLDEREMGWPGVKTKTHLYVVTENKRLNPFRFTFQWMAGTGTAFDTWLWKSWTFSWLIIFAFSSQVITPWLLVIKTTLKVYTSSKCEILGRVLSYKNKQNEFLDGAELLTHCWVHRKQKEIFKTFLPLKWV